MAPLRGCCAGLFVCFLFATAATGAPQHPKKRSKVRFQIVFEKRLDSSEPTQRFQDVDVYAMDQYGEHIRRLTSNHMSHSPAWSPDGKQIAYLSDDQPLLYSDPHDSVLEAFYKSMQRTQSLFRMNADETIATRVGSVDPEAQDVVWLPDSNGIALRKSDRKDLNVYLNHGRDYDSPFDRVGTVRELLEGREKSGKAWEDTSLAEFFPATNNYLPAFLLHTGKVGALMQREIYAPALRMSFVPDTNASLSAVSFNGESEDVSLAAFDTAWTQDGTGIAFSRFLDDKSGSTLFVIGDKPSKMRRLTQPSLDAHGPAWSADGKRLAFEGRWGDSQQIFLINMDGSGLAQLSHDALKSCAHPSWSPDRNWIVAECKWNTAGSNFPFAPFFELGGWYSSIYLFDVTKPTIAPRVLVDCGTNLGVEHTVDDRRCGAHNPSFAPQ